VLLVEFANRDGDPVWINPAHVRGVWSHDDPGTAAIALGSTASSILVVKGTPSDVANRLNWKG
jgi:hypothetical protein